MTQPVQLGEPINLGDVERVARGASVTLGEPARERVHAARGVIERAVEAGATMYGVTTGFGALADTTIDPSQASALQHGIVTSHATAVGPDLSRREARAMLLLRAHVLALGYSGVRVEVVERMVEMLNRDLIPAVPEQGSLGASGDLAPLACLALPLIGRGRILTDAGTEPAADTLARAGLEPLILQAKEGLALVNGTQGMLAIGILVLARAERLLRTADVIAAMTIEASLGTDAPFDERLQRLRPHPGQSVSAANLRLLLADSPIRESHRDSTHLVQDAYSLRCTPQVHGASRDTARHVAEVLGIEVNAVSDNPIVLVGATDEPDEVRSGGNFHGMPIAVVLDALALSLVSVASISDRRLYRLLDVKQSNGLPPFLVPDSGLNSGFMLIQYTGASLVSECKSLAHPASVDSIPSSAGQEDHVSMGMTAARHARSIVDNAEIVLALEALAAAQALDLRLPLRAGPAARAAHAAIRERVPFVEHDREFGADIDAAIDLVRTGRLADAAAAAVGSLA